jgi:hypothetical protein
MSEQHCCRDFSQASLSATRRRALDLACCFTWCALTLGRLPATKLGMLPRALVELLVVLRAADRGELSDLDASTWRGWGEWCAVRE